MVFNLLPVAQSEDSINLLTVKLELSDSKTGDSVLSEQLTAESLPFQRKVFLEDDRQFSVQVTLRTPTVTRVESLEQAWISFVEKESKEEYVFLPMKRTNDLLIYIVDVNREALQTLEGKRGDFFLKLVVGDTRIPRGLSEVLATNVVFNYSQKVAPSPSRPSGIFDYDVSWKFYPQEEIIYQLKQPAKRAPIFFSFLFTALVLLPLLIFIFWVVATFYVFPFELDWGIELVWSLVFHACIGGYLYSLVMFWLQWNIIKTWKVMLSLLPLTMISGYKVLKQVTTRYDGKTELHAKSS
eukprot:jgi/Galph1/5344/GphlegSOOS_G3996.1